MQALEGLGPTTRNTIQARSNAEALMPALVISEAVKNADLICLTRAAPLTEAVRHI